MKAQYEISPLRLGSSLQRQLAACGQGKASPRQWIGIIRNLQQKGVATAEVEWSRVLPLLEDCAECSKQLKSKTPFLYPYGFHASSEGRLSAPK